MRGISWIFVILISHFMFFCLSLNRKPGLALTPFSAGWRPLTFGLVLNAFGNGITISSNIGTLLCLLIKGPMIALADQHLWHNLHHNIALPKAISDRAE